MNWCLHHLILSKNSFFWRHALYCLGKISIKVYHTHTSYSTCPILQSSFFSPCSFSCVPCCAERHHKSWESFQTLFLFHSPEAMTFDWYWFYLLKVSLFPYVSLILTVRTLFKSLFIISVMVVRLAPNTLFGEIQFHKIHSPKCFQLFVQCPYLSYSKESLILFHIRLYSMPWSKYILSIVHTSACALMVSTSLHSYLLSMFWDSCQISFPLMFSYFSQPSSICIISPECDPWSTISTIKMPAHGRQLIHVCSVKEKQNLGKWHIEGNACFLLIAL